MILLVNNSYLNTKYSMIVYLRKALKVLKIPYYETTSLQNDILKLKPKIKGIIFSGSNLFLNDTLLFETFANDIRALLEFDVPVLGLCFGCQLLNLIFGGNLVYFNKKHEYFCEKLIIETKKNPLFENFDSTFDVNFCFSELPIMSKKDGIKEIACFYKNKKKYNCGFEFRKGKYYGLMFHPEKSEETYPIFLNFIKICKEYKK
jgi:GMP synthase (glutamine-hydrolysing)